MKDPSTAPADTWVIGIDNHGFVGRYLRNSDGGWIPFAQRHPLFSDDDMAGWIDLPELTPDFKGGGI